MKTTVRGIDIEYALSEPDEPAGQLPLVWGHGLSSSMALDDMLPVMVNLGRVGRQVRTLRYDARGHGLTSYTAEPEGYRWDEMARDQLALIDDVGIDRFALGGASMGAATALHTALQAPDRVDRLVLTIPPTGWKTRADQTATYLQMADILETRGAEVLIAAGAATAPPGPFADDKGYTARRAARIRAADPVKLAGVFRGAVTAKLPSQEDVATIAAPTLILAWTGDPVHPVGSAELLAELLPSATVSVASNRAEFKTWTDQILEFLAS